MGEKTMSANKIGKAKGFALMKLACNAAGCCSHELWHCVSWWIARQT